MKPSRKAIYKDGDRTWSWKFILRILTVVLAAVGIGCVAWAFTTSSGRFEDGYYSDFYGTVLVPWALIPLCLSILWNAANIAVLFSLNRPIAPGANVGCDLLLWLSLLGTGILLVLSAQDNIGTYYIYDDDYNDRYHDNHSLRYHLPSNHRQGVVEAVGSGFTFVVMLCHFALFVSACRYTHERRRTRMATMAREMVTEMTRNGQLAPALPPFSGTGGQYLPPQSFPALASQVLPIQPQKSFAASDPHVQVPQQQQQQTTYPLTEVKQPPRAFLPTQVQDPSSSWILPESMPNSAFYHVTTPEYDVENHRSSAEQQATVTSPTSPSTPVSPIISPQNHDNRDHSVIHSTFRGDEHPSRGVSGGESILQ